MKIKIVYSLFKFKLLIHLLFFLILTVQDNIYEYSQKFVTNLGLSSAIAISPYEDSFAVGASDGQLKLFNYNNANAQPIILQGHSTLIVDIIWTMRRYGIISMSSDSKNGNSLTIQWDNTFQQIYRWQFDTFQIYGASMTLSPFQGYIAFNHKTKVNQYNIMSKQVTRTINSRTGIADAKYSSGYQYLYVTQGPRIFTYTCGSTQGFFYEFPQTFFQQIQTDFANKTGNQMIVKQTNGNFSVFQRDGGRIKANIPIQNIIKYKYCQINYIIGLSVSKDIYIADKSNYQVKQIIKFKRKADVNVVSFICDKKMILIGHSNGEVDLYKLADDPSDFNFGTLVIILVCVAVVLIFLFIVWKKVIQKKILQKKAKKDSLLTNSQKVLTPSSMISST